MVMMMTMRRRRYHDAKGSWTNFFSTSPSCCHTSTIARKLLILLGSIKRRPSATYLSFPFIVACSSNGIPCVPAKSRETPRNRMHFY